MLNIPHSILEITSRKQNILIAGMGGGFDVYGGLPLYYTLKAMGKSVHLANYSFTNFDEVVHVAEPEIINNNLFAANAKIHGQPQYYPEGFLSQHFMLTEKEHVPVYMFKKTGVLPLMKSYQYLIDTLKLDLIILIDGGVDSLNTGLEAGHGTILEDSISIAALSNITIDKFIMCVGFGTEIEEKVCHYNVLQNMANLIKNNGFYGACSFVKGEDSYNKYEAACIHAFNQDYQPTSHIHRRIIPAVNGEFGNYHATEEDTEVPVFVSPLMSICWFFNFQAVFLFNKVVPYVSETNTFFEAVQQAMPFLKAEKAIPYNVLPY